MPRKPNARWSLTAPLLTLYYAFRDERTPWYAKWTTVLAGVYLLSPVDIVPDFIPVAGYLDDLVVVPFLLRAATGLLPLPVRMRAQQRAAVNKRRLRWLFIVLALLIVGLLAWVFISLSHHGQAKTW